MDPSRLAGIAIFSDLTKDELAKVARWTDEVAVPEGYELAREGQFAHEFFIIEEGTAEVVQDGEGIRALGPGDFFGEMALVGLHAARTPSAARRPTSRV